MSADIIYPEASVRKETFHTLSFVRPALRPGDRVLDISCGGGFVLAELAKEGAVGDVMGIDIVDLRAAPLDAFTLYDGKTIPLADDSYDVALLTFVLHHVPNELKAPLVAEARRVARRAVVVLEDTPRNAYDRFACNWHGKAHRKRIGTTAGFGFYDQPTWERFFAEQGFDVKVSRALPRWERDVLRPWARSGFVLEKKP